MQALAVHGIDEDRLGAVGGDVELLGLGDDGARVRRYRSGVDDLTVWVSVGVARQIWWLGANALLLEVEQAAEEHRYARGADQADFERVDDIVHVERHLDLCRPPCEERARMRLTRLDARVTTVSVRVCSSSASGEGHVDSIS